MFMHVVCLGAYGRASNADWEKKFVLEESWDSQKFLSMIFNIV
jgi:hypothetical protein